MHGSLRHAPAVLLVFGALAVTTGASHNTDRHLKMDAVAISPEDAVHSDLAFWGNHAFAGYYSSGGAAGGFRIFDVSNPASPCPPATAWQSRAWNLAGGTHKTGRIFFSDVATGGLLAEFHVGDMRPEPGGHCSASLGAAVRGAVRDLLVTAWTMGGVNVLDFTDPRRPREVAHYDMAPSGPSGSDDWSAYAYTGPSFHTGPGIPVYASDGMRVPRRARPGRLQDAARGREDAPRRPLESPDGGVAHLVRPEWRCASAKERPTDRSS